MRAMRRCKRCKIEYQSIKSKDGICGYCKEEIKKKDISEEKKREKIINKYWSKDFFEELSQHAFDLCEHDLRFTIHKVMEEYKNLK